MAEALKTMQHSATVAHSTQQTHCLTPRPTCIRRPTMGSGGRGTRNDATYWNTHYNCNTLHRHRTAPHSLASRRLCIRRAAVGIGGRRTQNTVTYTTTHCLTPDPYVFTGLNWAPVAEAIKDCHALQHTLQHTATHCLTLWPFCIHRAAVGAGGRGTQNNPRISCAACYGASD